MLTFAALLAPSTRATFLDVYWDKRPLYIPGNPDKFSTLPNLQQFSAMLAGGLNGNRWVKGYTGNAQASLPGRDGALKRFSAPPTMWAEMFNAGASLCFSAVDSYNRDLSALLADFNQTSLVPGQAGITSYLTPPQSGSGMHLDSQHGFFIQVSGEKTWKYSAVAGWKDALVNLPESALRSPSTTRLTSELNVAIVAPEETHLQEITLTAGDALYLPPGFWHDGCTNAKHSLHYTLTAMPLTAWQLLLPALRRILLMEKSLQADVRYIDELTDVSLTQSLERTIDLVSDFLHQTTPAAIQKSYVEMLGGNESLRPYLSRS